MWRVRNLIRIMSGLTIKSANEAIKYPLSQMVSYTPLTLVYYPKFCGKKTFLGVEKRDLLYATVVKSLLFANIFPTEDFSKKKIALLNSAYTFMQIDLWQTKCWKFLDGFATGYFRTKYRDSARELWTLQEVEFLFCWKPPLATFLLFSTISQVIIT